MSEIEQLENEIESGLKRMKEDLEKIGKLEKALEKINTEEEGE